MGKSGKVKGSQGLQCPAEGGLQCAAEGKIGCLEQPGSHVKAQFDLGTVVLSWPGWALPVKGCYASWRKDPIGGKDEDP